MLGLIAECSPTGERQWMRPPTNRAPIPMNGAWCYVIARSDYVEPLWYNDSDSERVSVLTHWNAPCALAGVSPVRSRLRGDGDTCYGERLRHSMARIPMPTGKKVCPRCHVAFAWGDNVETLDPNIDSILWVGMCETCMRDVGGCCSAAEYSTQHGVFIQHDGTMHAWNQPEET